MKEGCEGSYMVSITGIYRLVDLTKVDECQGVDQSRCVYEKVKGDSVTYLFYSKPQWKFLKEMHSDLFTTNAVYFEAADEPLLNHKDRLECYDGGFGSNKK